MVRSVSIAFHNPGHRRDWPGSAGQRDLQHLVHVLDEVVAMDRRMFFGTPVSFSLSWQDQRARRRRGTPRAPPPEFVHRITLPTQRNRPGHRDVGQMRDTPIADVSAVADGDGSTGPVLRNRAFRHVDVDVAPAVPVLGQAKVIGPACDRLIARMRRQLQDGPACRSAAASLGVGFRVASVTRSLPPYFVHARPVADANLVLPLASVRPIPPARRALGDLHRRAPRQTTCPAMTTLW